MENRNRQYRRESYIDGNVVRQPERAPERRRQYEEKSPEHDGEPVRDAAVIQLHGLRDGIELF